MEQRLSDLRQAAEGLLFLSETDAPFEAVDLGVQPREGFSPAYLAQLLGKPAGTRTETQEIGYCLRNMTRAREGASAERQAEAERFRQLQELLLASLSDAQAYRFGERRVEVYLLGWTGEGRLVGLKTLAVET